MMISPVRTKMNMWYNNMVPFIWWGTQLLYQYLNEIEGWQSWISHSNRFFGSFLVFDPQHANARAVTCRHQATQNFCFREAKSAISWLGCRPVPAQTFKPILSNYQYVWLYIILYHILYYIILYYIIVYYIILNYIKLY